MKTLFYPAYDTLEISEQAIPEYKPHEVLVRVSACGICGSELESFKYQSKKRTPPIIMGHEFCGVIEAVGSAVLRFHVGQRVVSNALVSCGECAHCERGQTNLCAAREVFSIHRNGAFGAFVNVPASSLVAQPAIVSREQACLAEPLANGVHLVNLTKHLPCARVLIIGAGPIGLMALQAFRALRGAECYVSDINTDRLGVAARLGASHSIQPMVMNLTETIASLTHSEGVDIVVDAVGLPQTAQHGLQSLRPGGALVVIGLQQDHHGFSSYELTTQEKQVIGSYAATQEELVTALQLMATGQVDVQSWVHYYPIGDGVQAFNDMLAAKDGHIKSVLLF